MLAQLYTHFAACAAYPSADNDALRNHYADIIAGFSKYGLGFRMIMAGKPTLVWDLDSLKSGDGIINWTERKARKRGKVIQFMKRARYDKQFKVAAVKLAQETDKSVSQTAKDRGISGWSLRRWINEYEEY